MKLALFDLDHTLLPIDSDHRWGQFTVAIGWADAHTLGQRNDAFYAQYQAGTLDIRDYVRFATEAVRLHGLTESLRAHERFMDEVIRPSITPAALGLLREHERQGDAVVIVTATNEFVTRPIAQALGVSELIALELERLADGTITGEIKGTPSFREGKVERVAQWLAARGLDWGDVQITFYSDSMNDLPLLEKAQHPVATNPDPRLRQLATQRGWRILDLFQE